MQRPVLRDYQAKLKNETLNLWNLGFSNVLAVMPTGGGKSVFLSDIISENVGAACAMAHRRELVSQLSGHLASFGIQHRIIAPKNVIGAITSQHRERFGRSFYNPSAQKGVASVQTLLARRDDQSILDWTRQNTLIVPDEAHHYLKENQFGKAVELFPNARVLGVTATPERSDGKGLGAHSDGIFQCMVEGPTTGQLMAMGSLCDYDYIAPPSDFNIDDQPVPKSGDWTPKQNRVASVKSHIVGDIVETYLKFAAGKRGITFAGDVETAKDIAARYRAAGVPAECIHAQTDESVRFALIRKFERGDLLQLVNVDLFGEGFDVPGCEVVSMGRPTQSLTVFLQQAGRPLRTADGKLCAIIIDHVMNWKRHGMPDTPRRWTLDSREKRSSKKIDPDKVEYKSCVECSKPYEAYMVACPWCGNVPASQPGARSSPEEVEGDLTRLDPEILAALRERVVLETPESVGERAGIAAGPAAAAGAASRQRERIQSQADLVAAIDMWAGRWKAKGLTDAELYRQFFITFGVDTTTAQTWKRKEMDELRERIQS